MSKEFKNKVAAIIMWINTAMFGSLALCSPWMPFQPGHGTTDERVEVLAIGATTALLAFFMGRWYWNGSFDRFLDKLLGK